MWVSKKEWKAMKRRSQDLERKIRDLPEKVVEKITNDLEKSIENANLFQKEGAEERKEEKDLPHEILKLIFDKYPDGVSVGEIRYILKEVQGISEDIQMVF